MGKRPELERGAYDGLGGRAWPAPRKIGLEMRVDRPRRQLLDFCYCENFFQMILGEHRHFGRF